LTGRYENDHLRRWGEKFAGIELDTGKGSEYDGGRKNFRGRP
jgi:hypothetical protein